MRARTAPVVEKKRQLHEGNDGHKSEDNISGTGGAALYLTFKLDLIKSEMISRANAGYRPMFGLDVRSLRVLRAICDAPGITASVLKDQTLIEKTLLSKLLTDLIERKLVRRSIHPDDARHFQLWPTTAGKRMRASSDELGQSMEAEMLSVLTADERRRLNSIIDKLADEFRKAAKGQAPVSSGINRTEEQTSRTPISTARQAKH